MRTYRVVIALCMAIVTPLAIVTWSHASPAKADKTLRSDDYEDRVKAAWMAQMIACMMGWQFEHQTASTEWMDTFPKRYSVAPIDDDWYYEMCAVRAFEKYGIRLTVEQLGRQWRENNCGSWGSSEQARLLLARGITPPNTGHPRYNKLWFTIGPQFSSDVYGLVAPGMPNVAGHLARTLAHINGYAEGVDGAVFMAGMVSLAFSETDVRTIVRKAARLLHPSSPYRQCMDLVIQLAEQGKNAEEVVQAVEDRWHIEYPATNNAVANGGIVAASVWFGSGDFLKTVNIAYRAADFTDADCNAANAAAVVAAMHGTKCLPQDLVRQLGDRIVGTEMGGVKLTPPVDESISDLARRTAAIGRKIVAANGGKALSVTLTFPHQEPSTQPAERFKLADLTKYWNPGWTLERAGFGGAGGGMGGIRGITHLDGDVLATYPRDEVRGVVLRRTLTLSAHPALHFQAGADTKRAWQLEVYAGNRRLLSRLIEGGTEGRNYQRIDVDLAEFAGKSTTLRLFQRVLIPDRTAGNAYWKALNID